MKNLPLVFVMVAMLSAGIGQLTMAGWSTCPAYSCSSLNMCDISAVSIGTCEYNGQKQWVYPVEACWVDTCYNPYEL